MSVYGLQRLYIAGAHADATSGKTFDTFDPATGELLARVQQASADDVDRAVASAREGQREWAAMTAMQRSRILRRAVELLRERNDALAELEMRDTGKPIAETRAVDIVTGADVIEYYAGLATAIEGLQVPLRPQSFVYTRREPLGVCAGIGAWNYPIQIACWKRAPALAAGNAMIFKPSEVTPLSALKLAEIYTEAGVPAGVFNVVPGGGEPGKLLALHRDVDCLAFTGSTGVGKLIMQYAGQSNLKRVWLELGGKSPNIVLPDCPDLDRAAKAAAGAIFYNMGEMCTAGSRLLVHREIKDAFVEKLVAAARAYKPGNPLDPNVSMGAIVDAIQLERVLGYIEAGRAEARLLLGGARVNEASGGFYIEPTVFDTAPDTRIAREEIFGPVLSMITFDSVDEAVRIANDSEYGLGAAVWTANLTTAHELARRLRAGTVWVNCYDEGGDMNFPFGGYKQSGNGRDKSLHALEKYTELKSTLVRLR